ncbi:MAG: extracellular solute-binding protein, partial [Chloroflexi bacterium]|nr:extracellular solute-binding protein [Chloroflexota bacterium]
MKRTIWLVPILLMVFALVLAGCGGGDEEPTPEPPPPTEVPAPEPTEPPPTEEPVAEAPAEEVMGPGFPVIPGGYIERAMAGEFAGTSVTVDGPFVDTDEILFNESMKKFVDATGIEVNYIGNKEFEGSISIRVDAGDAPDIADIPQPGLLANFARQGKIVDPTEWIPQEWLQQQYNQSWL